MISGTTSQHTTYLLHTLVGVKSKRPKIDRARRALFWWSVD